MGTILKVGHTYKLGVLTHKLFIQDSLLNDVEVTLLDALGDRVAEAERTDIDEVRVLQIHKEVKL